MEAISAAIRGGVAGCSGFHRESVPSVSESQSFVFPCVRNGVSSRNGLRTAVYPSCSSAAFEDQSHVQFYRNVPSAGTKFRVMRNSKAVSASASAVDVDYGTENSSKAAMKAKKVEKKAQKKLKKAAKADAGSSSSSSSSSSSESDVPEAVGRTRGTNMEQLRREWEELSRSPVMNSVRTISPGFVIEQPRGKQLVSPLGSHSDVRQVEGISSSQGQELVTPLGSYCDVRQVEGISSSDVSEALDIEGTIVSPLGNHCDVRQVEGISSSDVSEALERRMRSVGTDTAMSSHSHVIPTPVGGFVFPEEKFSSQVASATKVEVCMAGKCKKAGAQQILSAFQANGVAASACNKCMKNCKMAVNVRVQQEDDIKPRMYSGIRVEDAEALSRKYFGVGAAPMVPSLLLPSSGTSPLIVKHATADSLVY